LASGCVKAGLHLNEQELAIAVSQSFEQIQERSENEKDQSETDEIRSRNEELLGDIFSNHNSELAPATDSGTTDRSNRPAGPRASATNYHGTGRAQCEGAAAL